MKKHLLIMTVLMLALALVLGACSPTTPSSTGGDTDTADTSGDTGDRPSRLQRRQKVGCSDQEHGNLSFDAGGMPGLCRRLRREIPSETTGSLSGLH